MTQENSKDRLCGKKDEAFSQLLNFAKLWHKARSKGHPVRIELICEFGLLTITPGEMNHLTT